MKVNMIKHVFSKCTVTYAYTKKVIRVTFVSHNKFS